MSGASGPKNRRLSRRRLVQTGAGAAAAGLAAGGLGRMSAAELRRAQSDFDWQRYAGEEITVLLATSPRADLLTSNQAEFEDLTGIKVNADVVPEQQQRQKQVIEFTSGNPSFDVTAVSWHVQKGLFGKGGFLLDLQEFLNDPEMTAPDYDFADFSQAAITFATQPDGRIDTLPYNIDYWILYWNKELFEQKNVAFPQTFDEMVAAAQTLNDPDNGIFGFVARGLKNANVPVWTCFMQGWDARPIDDQGQLHTTEEAAVAAAELYQELLANYAP